MKESEDRAMPAEAARLIEELRRRLLALQHSRRTETAYVHWVRQWLCWAAPRSPRDLRGPDLEAFFLHLDGQRRLAEASRRQAVSALAFLHREVLGLDPGWMHQAARPSPRRSLPSVLSPEQVRRLFEVLPPSEPGSLPLHLVHATGVRLSEVVRLRIGDLDLAAALLRVRTPGSVSLRTVPIPPSLQPMLEAHVEARLAAWHEGRATGATAWPRAWLFPAAAPARGRDELSHLPEKRVQRVMRLAVRRSGIGIDATVHTLRHSFAVQALQAGVEPRTLQGWLGHTDLGSTLVYLQLVKPSGGLTAYRRRSVHDDLRQGDAPDEPLHDESLLKVREPEAPLRDDTAGQRRGAYAWHRIVPPRTPPPRHA